MRYLTFKFELAKSKLKKNTMNNSMTIVIFLNAENIF